MKVLTERLTHNSQLNVIVTTQGGKCTESQHENRVLYPCGLTQPVKNVHEFFSKLSFRHHGST